MIDIELGVAITIISYLVFVTSYIVSLRKDLNSLQKSFSSFETHFSVLENLREDFVRLETKIEILLDIQKEK